MAGRSVVATVLGAALLLSSCSSGGDQPPPAVDLGEPAVGVGGVRAHLEAARAAWQAADIQDYLLTYEVQCFCPAETVAVVVRGGQIDTVRPADARDPMTVPDVFARIATALADDPDEIEATFDADTGVPIELRVDPEKRAVDEEWGIVTEFEQNGSLPTVPESVDVADLTETWGCGHMFFLSNADQTVGLLAMPTAVDDRDRGPLPDAVIPSGAYVVEVKIGEDLAANWCDDVIEPEEPTPIVVEDWNGVGGRIEVVAQPTGACNGQPVTIAITGLVVERPHGRRVAVGDVAITNDAWGCFAG